MEFDNVSTFAMLFKVTGANPNFGRNFAMSGMSNFFTEENSTSCFTPSPTPSPTRSPRPRPTRGPNSADKTPSPTRSGFPPIGPSPTPRPVPLTSATGDPHLNNMYGDRFD